MSKMVEVKVPDIGDFEAVEVIEILVNEGDTVKEEDSLITVESDKATMEIPCSHEGVVVKVKVKIGDQVSEGSVVLLLETSNGTVLPEITAETVAVKQSEPAEANKEKVSKPVSVPPEKKLPPTINIDPVNFSKAHASPAIRKFARELGVDLTKVKGSGRNNRILREDVQGFVKQVIREQASGTGSGLNIEPIPEVDFSQWGEIESLGLSKINRLTGKFMHRNWINVPHVTQFDEADITDLESFRKSVNSEYANKGIKVTLLSFMMKAMVAALKEFPRFNSSLDVSGEHLILKKYFHIGVAVATPDGLVVPVIRNVDQKTLSDLAIELREISIRARDKKLTPSEMQGGCITISSLGGIGGTKFTPILNAPEVAILGVSRSSMQPVWNGSEFIPRLICPLSLSYDHRVIDGADGAAFTSYLSKLLSDVRRLLM